MQVVPDDDGKKDESLKPILDLFSKHGQSNYIGEQISQLEHALQVG